MCRPAWASDTDLHTDNVRGHGTDGLAVPAASRPDLDGAGAVLPLGVLAGVDLDAVEFAGVGGGEADDVLLVLAAEGDFGAVGDADLVPFAVDDWAAHHVEDGGPWTILFLDD